MYNLLIASDPEAWNGKPFEIEKSRCVREYTTEDITETLGGFSEAAIEKLCGLPSIFAHETGGGDPNFGILSEIRERRGMVRLRYQLHDIEPFLSADQLADLSFELDISRWELNRTHWAVKDVDLATELHRHGITLPEWSKPKPRAVDLSTHEFAIALSFPGEIRELVENIAKRLEGLTGPDSYFYDNNYVAQLARPSLDTFLQDIYGKQAKLLVVFIGADYQNKDWCGVEFRAIRQLINQRKNDRIMFVRVDDGNVDGVMPGDGFVDTRKYSPDQIAEFIAERAALLE